MIDSKIIDLPTRDLIGEMTGPQRFGNEVIIGNRVVPNMHMRDCVNEIEFVLDGRLCFAFPRDIAYQAADFAFSAMAIGAGFAHPSAMHFTQRQYTPEIVHLDAVPEK